MLSNDTEMRFMFEGAIKLQEEIIADANRRIEHYRWALAEMDKAEAAHIESMKVVNA